MCSEEGYVELGLDKVTRKEFDSWVIASFQEMCERVFDQNGRFREEYLLEPEMFCFVILRGWHAEVMALKDVHDDISALTYHAVRECMEGRGNVPDLAQYVIPLGDERRGELAEELRRCLRELAEGWLQEHPDSGLGEVVRADETRAEKRLAKYVDLYRSRLIATLIIARMQLHEHPGSCEGLIRLLEYRDPYR